MKKITSRILKGFIFLLFLCFAVVYLSNKNGYFAYKNYQKNVLTENGIKKFEEDLKDGNPIDINNYIEKDKDYSNRISKTSLYISDKLGNIIRNFIANFFKKITSNIE